LRERHQLRVRRETIFKFVKVRSGGRKQYVYFRPLAKKSRLIPAAKLQSDSAARPGHGGASPERESPGAEFNFTPSDRYNLTRLPPEEAARRRKKLEAEGH
jgi:hypothetical protein